MNTSVPHRSPWVRYSLVALVVLGLGLGAWTLVHRAHSSGDDHHHHGEAIAAMTLNDGKRWETDLPLRTGMQRIRDAVDQAYTARASGRLTAEETKALAATIQENVNYVIANCKLSPKADATLHVLITELLSGSAHLAQNPAAQQGLEQMGHAVRQYSDYFDHPGWVAFDPPKH